MTSRRWSPNELVFDVALQRPAVLVVNQNYESGWRASVGRTGAFQVARDAMWFPTPETVTPEVGLLGVELPLLSWFRAGSAFGHDWVLVDDANTADLSGYTISFDAAFTL